MIKRPFYIGLSVVLVSGLLTACSVLDFGRSEREATRAEDRAGRIDLAIGDKPLEADPEMVDVAVILPDSRLLEEWPQTGATASKVVGHVAAGADLEIAWRANAGSGTSRNSALTSPPVANRDTVFVIDSSQTVRAFSATPRKNEGAAGKQSCGLK